MCLLCLSICIIPSCLLTKMFEFLLLSLGLHVQPISWLGITLITCCNLQRPWVWFGRSNCPLGFEFHVRRICVSGVFAVVALSCWGIDVELGFFLYSEFQKFVQDFLSPWMLHGLCWQLVYQSFGATCRSNCKCHVVQVGLDCLIFKDGNDRLCRNVDKHLPTYAL